MDCANNQNTYLEGICLASKEFYLIHSVNANGLKSNRSTVLNPNRLVFLLVYLDLKRHFMNFFIFYS